MELQGFDYQDLGGGLNEGQPWGSIDPNEATFLRNFYPFGRRLVRRGGLRRLTSAGPWDQLINSIFPLKKSDGTWTLLVGGNTKMGKLVGNAVQDLPTGLSIPPSDEAWAWLQYKNYAYAMREGFGAIMRLNDLGWYTAGLAAPGLGPALADGGAGSLTAANYYGVYTFYNTETGMESNPSPASGVLALAGSRQISWTGIATSTNPFVNARRLYRTLPNQVGEYFYVGTIDNNVATSFLEGVIIADMGRSVSFNNGLPPAGIQRGVIWRERLFATDGTSVFYSEYLLPECFGEESEIAVYPDDGHQIRGLCAFGDRLIIGKTNKMHYLVGADRNSFNLLTLSDKHGCMSHHSMKSAEGYLFWYGTGNNFYRTDGSNVQEISTIKMRETLDRIPDEYAHKVVGAIYPSLSWYVVTVPQDGPDFLKVLVYNYKTDAWTIFTHRIRFINGAEISDPFPIAPTYLSDFYDENLEQVLYASMNDKHIYHYNDTSVPYDCEEGNPIFAEWIGRADDFGAPGYRKFFNEVWLNVPQSSSGLMSLSYYPDESQSPAYGRSVSLNIEDSAWKAYKFPTHGIPGTQIRFGFSYNGDDIISVDGIHFRVGVLARRPKQPV